ncbi:MAG: NADH-quinone oxidoreductase subunit NuoG [Thiolinea sp.]
MSDTAENRVSIEVNGQTLQARKGSMLIEATDAAGITVPRFCYHRKLSVAANCRMCLVEVERSAKPLPACATPVADGMKVWTRSEKARAAQQDVMEFLLINHPLDCPICDQGGECELQDVSMGYGNSHSAFVEVKRVVRDKDIGPLIETEMTRCIHCTRCVRFGEEIAGLRELGATGRGEFMEIGTYVEQAVRSELSGNVIDLCPVGALTAKPSRYQARAWEMQAHDNIAPHDAVGSHVAVHTFDGKVIRVVPRNAERLNECWISDRDRFSYEGLHSPERLLQPEIKRDGRWQVVGWQEALDAVAGTLRQADPEQLGGLASAHATLEELYLFQRLLRRAGFRHIDHRLRQTDFSDQDAVSVAPLLGVPIAELEQQQAVLLLGSNLRQDQPLLNHRVRKAVLAGAQVMALNPYAVDFNYELQQTVVAPLQMVAALAALVKAAAGEQALPDAIQTLCQDVTVTEAEHGRVAALRDSDPALILLGNMAMQHPQLAQLRALAVTLAGLTGAVCGCLPAEANAVGAALAGVLPHRGEAGLAVERPGLPVRPMLEAGLATYVLLHAEPDDFNDPALALQAFRDAKDVIALTEFAGEGLRDVATILLPAAAFTETAGTLVNAQGDWQSFQGAAPPPGEARPGWKILRVLGNRLDIPDFDYVSPREVLAELRLDLQSVRLDPDYVLPEEQLTPVAAEPGRLQRVGDVHMYRSDALVRRARSLQAMVPEALACLHPAELERRELEPGTLVKLTQERGSVQLPVQADSAVPEGAVRIQAGTVAAATLGAAFGYVTVDRV